MDNPPQEWVMLGVVHNLPTGMGNFWELSAPLKSIKSIEFCRFMMQQRVSSAKTTESTETSFSELNHASPKNSVLNAAQDWTNPFASRRGYKLPMRPCAKLLWTPCYYNVLWRWNHIVQHRIQHCILWCKQNCWGESVVFWQTWILSTTAFRL